MGVRKGIVYGLGAFFVLMMMISLLAVVNSLNDLYYFVSFLLLVGYFGGFGYLCLFKTDIIKEYINFKEIWFVILLLISTLFVLLFLSFGFHAIFFEKDIGFALFSFVCMIFFGVCVIICLSKLEYKGDKIGKKEEKKEEIIEISWKADKAKAFGYRSSWMAVKCEDYEKIASAFSKVEKDNFSENVVKINWESAMDDEKCLGIFMTPVRNKYVIINLDGWGIFDDYTQEISKILKTDVQFFYTFRVMGDLMLSWYKNGKLLYKYSDVEGDVERGIEEVGEDPLPPKDKNWRKDYDEDIVFKRAAIWSYSPEKFGDEIKKSFGYLMLRKGRHIFKVKESGEILRFG